MSLNENSPAALSVPVTNDNLAEIRKLQAAASARSGSDPASPTQTVLWFDGQLHPVDAPLLPVTTHALHYGSGVFEGIRSYATADGGAAVFRLPEHLERMARGCALLGLSFDPTQASSAILQTLRANQHRDAYVRPLAWCGTGSIGLDVDAVSQHLMVTTLASKVHLAIERVRLTRSAWQRNPARSLPPLKLCGGYINSILAKREAKARGFDEALFVDAHGNVVECTGANVFLVRDDRVIAVEHPDALAGITRDTVIKLTGAETRRVSVEELREADEVFVCGTAAEVMPIHELDGRNYASSLGCEIADCYRRAVRGEDTDTHGWLTHV